MGGGVQSAVPLPDTPILVQWLHPDNKVPNNTASIIASDA